MKDSVPPTPKQTPIKVKSPASKAVRERIYFWTRMRWKLAYWKQAHWQMPGLKSPAGLALMGALLLVLVLVPLASAASYTVQSGDTLFQIARRNNTTVAELAAANNLADPNMIMVGQQLEIPGQAQSSPVNTLQFTPLNSTTVAADQAHAYAGTETTYIVQHGDTLYSIATTYSISVEAIVSANNLSRWHRLQVGEVLIIPAQAIGPYEPTTPLFPSTLPDTPYTPPTTETDPDVQGNLACTRFNFAQGRDAYRGSLTGVYLMVDANGRQIASWYAAEGEIDSGWINGLPIAFTSVHVRVLFYPKWGGGSPIQMDVVNPAPGTNYGWLTRGLCHSVEIQYPDGY